MTWNGRYKVSGIEERTGGRGKGEGEHDTGTIFIPVRIHPGSLYKVLVSYTSSSSKGVNTSLVPESEVFIEDNFSLGSKIL